MTRYVFHITCAGVRTEWRGLSKAEAQKMYRLTARLTPYNVDSFGWEEQT